MVLDKFAEHTTKFVASIHSKEVVLGGGLSIRHADELAKISAKVGVPLRVTSFGPDGGLYGALALIKNKKVASTRGIDIG